MTFPLKLGSQGPDITALDVAAVKRYKSYAFEIDGRTPLKADGYYGRGEQAFVTAWQTRMHRPVTGTLSADEFNFIVHGTAFPVISNVNDTTWLYSSPGSGADYDVGPSFEIGVYAEQRYGIKHQPVQFAKGGYLGFLGGDPTFSYIDVTYDQYMSIKWLLDNNPTVQATMVLINGGMSAAAAIAQTRLKLIFSAYSQSADGLEDALEILFGDGGFKIPKTGEIAPEGPYKAIRGAIRRIIQFGNPSRQQNAPMSGVVGWNPTGWGISRKIRPAWMRPITVSITNPNDFYADVPDDEKIRPLFYGEIVESKMSLPFFVHVLNVAVPIIMEDIPVVGGLLGPFAPIVVAGMAGLNAFLPLLTGLMSQMSTGGDVYDKAIDAQITQLLSVSGIVNQIPELITMVGDLPGLQNHGMYDSPFAELGGLSGVQVGQRELDLIFG